MIKILCKSERDRINNEQSMRVVSMHKVFLHCYNFHKLLNSTYGSWVEYEVTVCLIFTQ